MKKKIFINGMNAKVAGGKNILNNFLSILYKYKEENMEFYILTPSFNEYKKYENNIIKIIDINNFLKKNTFFLLTYIFILPKIIDKLKIDIIFNLSDIPIPSKAKQIFLFDWAYAVYPNSVVWKKMDIKSLFIRKIKLFFFKKYLIYINTIIVQTNTMKKRLEFLYNIKGIKVIPNALSLKSTDKYKNFNLPKNYINLLYLTHYYPHKNLEIFIPLGQRIKKEKLKVKIIITIHKNQHLKAKKLLEQIKNKKLDDIIINVGSIEMQNVPSLYKQCNGLLMPTLLESYGLTYFEAMYYELPIFTSNLDFAEDACKDTAFYFNPLDENDILNTLKESFKDNLLNEKTKRAKKIINELDKWNETVEKYLKIIKNNL